MYKKIPRGNDSSDDKQDADINIHVYKTVYLLSGDRIKFSLLIVSCDSTGILYNEKKQKKVNLFTC